MLLLVYTGDPDELVLELGELDAEFLDCPFEIRFFFV